MPASRRSATTIYLDPQLSRALKVKAAVSGRSLSELANAGLRRILSEDERDLKTVRRRRSEPARPYEEVVAELRRGWPPEWSTTLTRSRPALKVGSLQRGL